MPLDKGLSHSDWGLRQKDFIEILDDSSTNPLVLNIIIRRTDVKIFNFWIMTIAPRDFWKDYELVDSGNFEKLERFGRFYMSRPEPKALWEKTLSEDEWEKTVNVVFKPGAGFGKAGKEDSGTWDRRRKLDECLYDIMKCVASILAPQDSFLVLNLYSNGYSAVLGETVVRQAFGIKGACPGLECGELVLKDRFGKNLPLSI